jgi:anti-sigma regulatory factor (Ser/Thr protein kinase)
MDARRWDLPPSAEAPALTRQLIAETCQNGLSPSRIADCSLMATELVTNAVVHGREPITLTIDCDGPGHVRVEVRDEGDGHGMAHSMTEGSSDRSAETGRGLLIVAALSERWGMEFQDRTTCAWFELC